MMAWRGWMRPTSSAPCSPTNWSCRLYALHWPTGTTCAASSKAAIRTPIYACSMTRMGRSSEQLKELRNQLADIGFSVRHALLPAIVETSREVVPLMQSFSVGSRTKPACDLWGGRSGRWFVAWQDRTYRGGVWRRSGADTLFRKEIFRFRTAAPVCFFEC
jgi:hypothetical protein